MKYIFVFFLLMESLLLADDWAKIIIRDSGSSTNFFGTKEWTIGTVIQSNRMDIIGTTIRLAEMSGQRGDTVVVCRYPKTSYWYLK